MKTTKFLLSTVSATALIFAFSICSQTAAVNNSPATVINKTNSVMEAKTDSSTANNAAPQSNTTNGKKNVTKTTDREKREIFQLIKKDKEISDFLADFPKDADKLMEAVTIRKMNLNSDRQKEYVAVIENGYLCGAHANCPHWIYRKKSGQYNLLLQTRDQVVKLEKTSTNGFRDLRSEGSGSAITHSYTIYKFDGNKYQADKCVVIDESGKMPKETRIDCKRMGEENQ